MYGWLGPFHNAYFDDLGQHSHLIGFTYVEFEVPAAVSTKGTIFSGVTLSCLVQ
jgi:hypothetical protein